MSPRIGPIDERMLPQESRDGGMRQSVLYPPQGPVRPGYSPQATGPGRRKSFDGLSQDRDDPSGLMRVQTSKGEFGQGPGRKDWGEVSSFFFLREGGEGRVAGKGGGRRGGWVGGKEERKGKREGRGRGEGGKRERGKEGEGKES